MLEVQDFDLVRGVQGGDKSAFTLLVRRHEKLLNRLVLRYVKDEELAKDILQEAFLKTYLSLSSFEFRCSFKNWLYKIALNTARNKLRALKDLDNIDDVVIAEKCSIEGDMIHEELILSLKAYVGQLPEKQKQTIELRVFCDLSFKEVSERMNCPYDTAKANYRHAMLKLKECFELQKYQIDHGA